MVQLEEFYPDIALSVGNIHDGIMDQAIIGAAIEFCDKTHVWQEDLNDIVIQANTPSYPVNYDKTLRQLIVLTDVYVDGQRIDPTNEKELREHAIDWPTRTALKPSHYFMESPDVIRFYRAPNDLTDSIAALKGALKPSRKAKALPHLLFDDHYDAITHGALKRLHSQPGKDWYSMNDAMESKRIFNEAVSTAQIRVFQSRTNRPQRTRIRGAA